jgi:biotin carboxyl carrier protein
MLAAMNRSPKSYRVKISGAQLQATSGEHGVRINDEYPAGIEDGRRLRSFSGLRSDGARVPIYVEEGEREHEFIVYLGGEAVHVHLETPRDERLHALRKNTALGASVAQIVKAPMPGLLKQILVPEGVTVEKGASLCILEAMKMENEIKSPGTLRVKRLIATPGTAVEKGAPLIELQPIEASE